MQLYLVQVCTRTCIKMLCKKLAQVSCIFFIPGILLTVEEIGNEQKLLEMLRKGMIIDCHQPLEADSLMDDESQLLGIRQF